MKYFLLCLFSLLLVITCYSQKVSPKREFRAVWIASVANIDWPSQKSLSPVVQQAEYRYILDEQQKNGMNAVIVQVRPAADALYRSAFEPWSEWLTGKQGREPNPPYDPLTFLLNESHERGLEFHAWFNPYRATFDTTSVTDPQHITRTRPDWFLTYEGKLLFNPGLPEVRTYITKIIMDVVRRYDIDGVHFDDYFYPYPVVGIPIPDDSTFKYFNAGLVNKEDWRRYNVDALIKTVSDSIKAIKPHVKFGISPFGVWKNQPDDPLGSATRAGVPSYTTLYADTRKWLQEGWIDYVVPQVYWHIGHPAADYKTIVEWWTRNSFNRHLYIGHGPYKINRDTNPAWHTAQEIPRQLRLNRTLPVVQGSVFFSSKSVMNNPNYLQDSLRTQFYKYPALLPLMDWKKNTTPPAPLNLKVTPTPQGNIISWQGGQDSPGSEPARYYVIYRYKVPEPISVDNPQHIIGKVFGTQTTFADNTSPPGQNYKYGVTALDRLQNESLPAKIENIQVKKRFLKKLKAVFSGNNK
jgi:uncharacterized lipoprotein YddW (UPF0748 family)